MTIIWDKLNSTGRLAIFEGVVESKKTIKVKHNGDEVNLTRKDAKSVLDVRNGMSDSIRREFDIMLISKPLRKVIYSCENIISKCKTGARS